MSEIVVSLLSTFNATYPRSYFYKDENGLFHYDSSKVTVFGDLEDIFYDNYPSHVKLENSSECLNHWKKTLTEKPLVFLVSICRVDAATETCRSRGEYVVFIKSPHVVLRSQILEAFCQCENFRTKGKKFSLNISVQRILHKWYASHFPRNMGYSIIQGASVTFSTWSKTASDCVTHPLFWGGCLPLAIFCGVPYFIYRAAKHKNVNVELEFAEVVDATLNLSMSGSMDVFLESIRSAEARRGAADLFDATNVLLRSAYNNNPLNESPPAYETLSESLPPPYDFVVGETS